ncbi:MAG: class I SAM-dependent methyltransferase [Planctomycetota bacterium]
MKNRLFTRNFLAHSIGFSIAFWCGAAPFCLAQRSEAGSDKQFQQSPTLERTADASSSPLKPGLNDEFLDPNLKIDQWLGRFEVESREVFSSREKILELCELRLGMRVADIGAGTGFYSRLFSSHVGDGGWVYAVDISGKFLKHINAQAQKEDISNLTSVFCTDNSCRLPPESVDLVFICDTYHHFEHPQATLASILSALKPGGMLVLIDFERIPGKSREFIIGHVRAGKEVFQREVVESGFRFVEEIKLTELIENYFLRFRKPKDVLTGE